MKIHQLNQFIRGWIVGNFEPSILKIPHAELMIRSYKMGDVEPRHVHKKAHEITIIINGIFEMNGIRLTSGDIIHLSPNDSSDFICIEDGTNVVFKTPSIKNDKYFIN